MTLHKRLFKNLAVGDWFYTNNSITGTICLHRKTTAYKYQTENIERVNCIVWERSFLAYCDGDEEVMFVAGERE